MVTFCPWTRLPDVGIAAYLFIRGRSEMVGEAEDYRSNSPSVWYILVCTELRHPLVTFKAPGNFSKSKQNQQVLRICVQNFHFLNWHRRVMRISWKWAAAAVAAALQWVISQPSPSPQPMKSHWRNKAVLLKTLTAFSSQNCEMNLKTTRLFYFKTWNPFLHFYWVVVGTKCGYLPLSFVSNCSLRSTGRVLIISQKE